MAKRRESIDEKVKRQLNKENFKKTLRIFKFALPYKGTFLVGMVFLVLSQITAMSFPLLMSQMIGAIKGESKYSLPQISLFILVVLVLQAVFSFFRVYTFTQVSEQTIRDIRKTLYSKMITLPIFFFEKNRVGELMSRITSDISLLQDVFSVSIAELFRQVFTLLGGVVIILFISIKLSLFMLAIVPLLAISAIFFGKFIRKNAVKTQDELAKTNVIVEETLQTINVVKAFTNEGFEVNRYAASLQKVLNYALKSATYRGAFISFIILTTFGSIVGVVWYGGSLVQQGELPFQMLFAFILYTVFIGGSVGGLGDMYGQIQRTIGTSERILEILEEESEVQIESLVPQKDQKVTGTVSYQNVEFSYPSRPDVGVLKDISFTIQSGSKIALVGQSGGGKTTIAALLMRNYPLSGGKILIDGQDIAEMNLTKLRENIAIVPQEVLLFGGTIEENIAYGKPNATYEEIQEAAQKANALSFIEGFPDGLQTIVGDRGIKLSGGQRQRIAIARAILKDPAILILDEATSALDSESEKSVQEALDRLMQDRTTLIIAHRLATIRNVDKIYVLQNGQVTESGTHEELVQQDGGIYANLVKLQFEMAEVLG